MMMEAASTSETSVNFYQTTWCYNPEGSHLIITVPNYVTAETLVQILTTLLMFDAFLITLLTATAFQKHMHLNNTVTYINIVVLQHNMCVLKECDPATDINLKQEVESLTESAGDVEVRNLQSLCYKFILSDHLLNSLLWYRKPHHLTSIILMPWFMSSPAGYALH
jgi:hypothetical protein